MSSSLNLSIRLDVKCTEHYYSMSLNHIWFNSRKYKVDIHYVAGNLSKLSDIEAMCTQIHSLYPQGVDILVNSAGTYNIEHKCLDKY